ncbi:unnamed protein product [Moneuplotes crassus]|uniref:Uncharacterized protein n=1 Tax=Euplotes crassus TaxID=5936 RepID=A0AAD1U5R4_EUPCR|nr:unnamed protein product [Moneuplotes crassus]
MEETSSLNSERKSSSKSKNELANSKEEIRNDNLKGIEGKSTVEHTSYLKRVPKLKTEMNLRNKIAYNRAVNVLKVEKKHNKDLELSKEIKEYHEKGVKREVPKFLKRSLEYSSVYDGKILDEPKSMTREQHAENLKRIKEYNREQALRSRIDRAVQQTIKNIDNHAELAQKEREEKELKLKEEKEREILKIKENEEIKENQQNTIIIKNKNKQKNKTKRSLGKSKTKNKIKEVPPYTQAELLKNRKKVLSKMPLFEALYRGITGKPKACPKTEILEPKSKSQYRPSVKIRKSSLKASRNIHINDDQLRAKTTINDTRERRELEKESEKEVKNDIKKTQSYVQVTERSRMKKMILGKYNLGKIFSKEETLSDSPVNVTITRDKKEHQNLTTVLLKKNTKNSPGKDHHSNKLLEDFLKSRYFKQYQMDAGESIFYSKASTSLDQELNTLIKSRSLSYLNPPSKQCHVYTQRTTRDRASSRTRANPKFNKGTHTDRHTQFIVKGDSILRKDSFPETEGSEAFAMFQRLTPGKRADTTTGFRSKNNTNYEDKADKGCSSSIKFTREHVLSTIARATGREIRIKPALNMLTKDKCKSQRNMRSHIRRLTKKKDIMIGKNGIVSKYHKGELDYIETQANKVSFSPASFSETTDEQYIPNTLYGNSAVQAVKISESHRSLQRNTKSQALIKRYNLVKENEGQRPKDLQDMESRVIKSKIHFQRFYEKKNVSFMKMLSKLESKLHKQNQNSLEDLMIQKRRLVANQNKRFKGIKVNHNTQGREGEQSYVVRERINTDIEKYKKSCLKKGLTINDNSGKVDHLQSYDPDLINNNKTLFKKNTVSTDKCIQNEFSSLSSSKSFRRNDIKNEGSLDSENNQDASDKINSRLSIRIENAKVIDDILKPEKLSDDSNCSRNNKLSNSAKSISVLSAKYNSWTNNKSTKKRNKPSSTSANFKKNKNSKIHCNKKINSTKGDLDNKVYIPLFSNISKDKDKLVIGANPTPARDCNSSVNPNLQPSNRKLMANPLSSRYCSDASLTRKNSPRKRMNSFDNQRANNIDLPGRYKQSASKGCSSYKPDVNKRCN